MAVADRREFCLGLGSMAAMPNLRSATKPAHPDAACASAALAGSQPALLQRPATGVGSPRLVDVPIRQEARIYKKTLQGDLAGYVFFPPDWRAQDRRPAMAFFFGGGWKLGTPQQFIPEAEYFASRGMVCATFDYRTLNKYGGTPDTCIADAKSAIRWLRSHAGEFGIDPDRMVAAGGSAGAHLAAATAFIAAFDEDSNARPVSCLPNALLLFNPPLNLTGMGFRDSFGKPMGRALSPIYSLRHGAPPSILFYGAEDRLLKQGEEFYKQSLKLGNRCELYIANGRRHGFFNGQPWLTTTVIKADEFLCGLGYLNGTSPLRPDGKNGEILPYSGE